MAATLSPPSKVCAYALCPVEFTRRPTDHRTRWDARRYCSVGCGRRDRPRVEPETKLCEHCGGEFTRDPARQGPNTFAARLYCGEACTRAARVGRTTAPHVRARPAVTPRPRRRTSTAPAIPVVSGPRPMWRPNAPGWDPAGPRIA